MSKQGTEYELFIKEIYENLNAVDGLSDVNIQHDVKLRGASGEKHQIDVYWTFSKGGVNYQVAIECKDYNKKINIGLIRSFHDTLNDIGNIHGIFVSKMGFQSGAKRYAEAYGIQLMEIRHPTEEDWANRMKNLHLILEVYSIDNVKPHFTIDVEKMKLNNINTTKNDTICLQAMSDQVFIEYDEMISTSDPKSQIESEKKPKKTIKSLYDLIKLLPQREPGHELHHVFRFVNGRLLYTNELGKEKVDLPLKEASFTYDVYRSQEETHIYGDDVIKAIVKNICDGTQKTVDKFGRVRTRDSIENSF